MAAAGYVKMSKNESSAAPACCSKCGIEVGLSVWIIAGKPFCAACRRKAQYDLADVYDEEAGCDNTEF